MAGPVALADGAGASEPTAWLIINDAYNANPESMRAALKTLAAIWPGPVGANWSPCSAQMAELGDGCRDEHDAIGRLAVRLYISRSSPSGAAHPIDGRTAPLWKAPGTVSRRGSPTRTRR